MADIVPASADVVLLNGIPRSGNGRCSFGNRSNCLGGTRVDVPDELRLWTVDLNALRYGC